MADLTDRTLITEEDIRAISMGSTLLIASKALVTPLAADLARERRITLERVTVPLVEGRPQKRRVAIGADHGGFEMKEELKKLLEEIGTEYQDFGTNSTAAV